MLPVALKTDTGQGVVGPKIACGDIDHQRAVGKGGIALLAAHAVGDDASCFGSPSDDDAAGTHAEGIGAAPCSAVVVGNGVIGDRQVGVTWAAILDAIDQLLGVFHA